MSPASVCLCVAVVVCVFVRASVAASVGDAENEEARQLLVNRLQPYQPPMPSNTPERELMNRVLSRVLDLTYEMFREMGASQQDLKDLHQKRGMIQACYFQAISCY